jgi:hypothetical protein
MVRPRSRSNISLFLFAFVAASAFVLVNVVDPYSGATASPYFQMAGDRFGGQATQGIQVDGAYTNTVARDGFTVVGFGRVKLLRTGRCHPEPGLSPGLRPRRGDEAWLGRGPVQLPRFALE